MALQDEVVVPPMPCAPSALLVTWAKVLDAAMLPTSSCRKWCPVTGTPHIETHTHTHTHTYTHTHTDTHTHMALAT